MLVVTGTQRSGTSLIATALVESGYELGGIPWDKVGGYENATICGFYNKYLGDPTFPFSTYDWPIIRPEQFAAMGYQVTKFSFLLMNPTFVAIWHKFRPEGDTFLVMNRNKQHVIESKRRMQKQFQHDSLLLKQMPAGLRENFYDSVRALNCLGYRYQWLNFPQCVSDLGKINEALTALDPDVQIKPEVWESVFDPTKIHFK